MHLVWNKWLFVIIPTCKAFQCGYCLATNDPKWVSLNPRGPQSPLTRLSPLLLFWYDKTLTQRQQSHAQDTAFPTDCLIYGEQCMSPGESFYEWPPWPSKLLSTWNFQSAEMKRIRWSNFISKILIYYYYFFFYIVPGWPGTSYVAGEDLNSGSSLPLPSNGWGYMLVPLGCLVCVVLGVEACLACCLPTEYSISCSGHLMLMLAHWEWAQRRGLSTLSEDGPLLLLDNKINNPRLLESLEEDKHLSLSLYYQCPLEAGRTGYWEYPQDLARKSVLISSQSPRPLTMFWLVWKCQVQLNTFSFKCSSHSVSATLTFCSS